MNRVSVRTKYLGAAPACYGKAGWVHWPTNDANAARWTFEADDGTETPCNQSDVVWCVVATAANAA
jgi:hypothetical protein